MDIGPEGLDENRVPPTHEEIEAFLNRGLEYDTILPGSLIGNKVMPVSFTYRDVEYGAVRGIDTTGGTNNGMLTPWLIMTWSEWADLFRRLDGTDGPQ